MADPQLDESARTTTRARPAKDRFDAPYTGRRVGAHRMGLRPRRVWQYLIAAVLGIAVLTTLGVLAVQRIGADVSGIFETGKAAVQVKRVEPKLDPAATVAVLNGTGTDGMQDTVAKDITKNEWGSIAFTDVAASDVKISAVFYGAKTDEAAALGLAKELGGVSTYRSSDYDQYGVRLVVLLGADYAGPGSEALTSNSSAAG